MSPSGSASSSSRKYSRGHFRGGRRGFVALNNADSADSTTTGSDSDAKTDGVPGTSSLKLSVRQGHEPNRPNDDDGDGYGYDDDDALLTDAGDIGGASASAHSVKDKLLICDEDGTTQESVFGEGERAFVRRARRQSVV